MVKDDMDGQSQSEDRGSSEFDKWAARVSVWARAETLQAMSAIARWVEDEWGISYDRPELLRFITQIALQVVDLGLVQRRGLNLVLDVPATPLPQIEDNIKQQQGGQRMWVSRPTTDGLSWLQGWMRQQKMQPSHGDVLKLAVDFAMQALFAGLVEAPRGPHVIVRRPCI